MMDNGGVTATCNRDGRPVKELGNHVSNEGLGHRCSSVGSHDTADLSDFQDVEDEMDLEDGYLQMNVKAEPESVGRQVTSFEESQRATEEKCHYLQQEANLAEKEVQKTQGTLRAAEDKAKMLKVALDSVEETAWTLQGDSQREPRALRHYSTASPGARQAGARGDGPGFGPLSRWPKAPQRSDETGA
ncbi:hypothetical protein NHX12_034047 [Muraenolepis orangiensis]|uniref:Uncharacterized protein n=1 Tax=Muraenolepis orangiensis TaxID=630683 RepID=A0A9Q0E3F0_9TELE|nr:hypothetical protein NHX12_034047 [Muraenolepis orangiensis]